MSETAPEQEVPSEESAAKERKHQVINTLYQQAEEAIAYLDAGIDQSLAYLAKAAPTPEEKDAQIAALSDLAAYSAGTLKRLIVVLGEMTRRPVNLV
ncbi:hypothetical protein AVT26_gp48 [Streptomyces phage Lannister]|uniref:Uncharacterized protein n=1 Tax=Streptomyces phage Lannister TaxID=1674927 RepID=A0A0K1Y9E5_9CAUD|nr:hypothetical protein AVT26_gp48 [Streptomyces phage Lannister]AKY03730.1 hypothetical protein SEA_LANNISTER_48 [Streptomyces phage Lannister]